LFNRSVNTLKDIDFLVLCGGLGKRLRSEIGESQKTLARIHDRPFLEFLLTELHAQGFRRFILCAGYKADDVEDFAKKISGKLMVEVSKELEPLGTGGAIKNARKFVRSNTFVALNGDSFCPLNYKEFVEFHRQHKAIGSIVLTQVHDPKDYGSILVDNTDRIVSFQEKIENASSNVISTGIYCFEKHIFDLMPSEKSFSIEKDFFPKIAGKGLYGYHTPVQFLDIGTPERFSQAKDYLKKGG